MLLMILEVLPRSRVIILQEKFELFDMQHRLICLIWVAVVTHHFKIYKSSVKTIVNKGKGKLLLQLQKLVTVANFTLLMKCLLSHIENVTLLCG